MRNDKLAEIAAEVGEAQGAIRLSGTLGVEQAEELRTAALEMVAAGKDVRIDWIEAAQIDASILQVMLSLGAALAAAGRSLAFGAPSPEIAEYLRIAGLSSILDGEFGR